MADPLAEVSRQLNKVGSVAQAGAAARAALRHVEATLDAMPTSWDIFDVTGTKSQLAAVTRTLEGQVGNLEGLARKYPTTDASPIDTKAFAAGDRKIINRAYVEAAGAEGLASGLPTVSDAAKILGQSIAGAPAAFLAGVKVVASYSGEIAGTITGAAGGAAGSLIWNFLKGGAWPLVLLAIVAFVVGRKLGVV